MVHGGGLEVVSKNILIPIRKNPMVNSVNYRKYAKYPVFRDDVTFFFLQKADSDSITTLNFRHSAIRKHIPLE